jgi:hypothetical protein
MPRSAARAGLIRVGDQPYETPSRLGARRRAMDGHLRSPPAVGPQARAGRNGDRRAATCVRGSWRQGDGGTRGLRSRSRATLGACGRHLVKPVVPRPLGRRPRIVPAPAGTTVPLQARRWRSAPRCATRSRRAGGSGVRSQGRFAVASRVTGQAGIDEAKVPSSDRCPASGDRRAHPRTPCPAHTHRTHTPTTRNRRHDPRRAWFLIGRR